MPSHRAFLLSLLAPIVVATTHVSSASAALIALDLFTAGDGLITRDTETGLDWLDLTATVNRSYSDIEADVGGWISLGFHHATGSEVCGLFAHALAPSPCPGPDVSSSGNLVATLQGYVGVTGSSPTRSIDSAGAFDDGDASDGVGYGHLQYSVLGGSSASLVRENQLFAAPANAFRGHWLVRPVPEPSTALLLAAGLTAFAVRRRYAANLTGSFQTGFGRRVALPRLPGRAAC